MKAVDKLLLEVYMNFAPQLSKLCSLVVGVCGGSAGRASCSRQQETLALRQVLRLLE
jgi:hypothetical protein